MSDVSPLVAAKRLAADLNLPAQRGSVFVWHTDAGLCLVVAADPEWLENHHFNMHEYLGFPVERRDRLNGIAFPAHH